jgi:hypothetical protein
MAVPMIDDLELTAVQWIRQESAQGYAAHQVAGLDGTVHQKLGRRSHRVALGGVLLGETAADDLQTLQEKAAAGDEIVFTADISTALEVEKMVIDSLSAEQEIGSASRFSYALALVESPPLPPPAELSPFGGLDDFGLGDLGFDTDALGGLLEEVAAQAGAITGAIDAAMDAVAAVGALASLADLGDLSNPLKPVSDKIGELSELGTGVVGAVDALSGLLP